MTGPDEVFRMAHFDCAPGETPDGGAAARVVLALHAGALTEVLDGQAAELTVRPPFRLPAHHTRPVHRQASALHAITRPQVYLHSARGERSISCGSAGAGYLALETLERVRALHANARAASRLSAGAPKAHWLD